MKHFSSVSESCILLKTKAFNVQEEILSFNDGTTTRHITAIHRGAVVIIPKLNHETFLLIRQYRHSVGTTLLEFPAGTLEESEDPFSAAKRELIEEVQHSARQWISLGLQHPTPGFCNEVQHCFIACDLYPKAGILDEDEIIDVLHLTKNEIEASIIRGEITDAKSISIYTKAKLMGYI